MRDTGLDVARGVALIGIVAAHTISDNSSLLFVLGNGIAPLIFAALTGVTMARTGIPTIRNAVLTGGFLFILGVALGYTSSPVISVLQTLGVLHIATAVIARAGRIASGTLGLILVVTGPFVQAALSGERLGSYSPGFHGDWDGWFMGLAVNGTYPLVTWLGVPLIGFAIGRMNLTGLKGVTSVILPIAGFSIFHWLHGSKFDRFGDVAHLLSPVVTSPEEAAWIHLVPYGHTGSLTAVLVSLWLCMGIIGVVNSVELGITPVTGANTLTGYCLNVLMCTMPELRGTMVEFIMQVGVIILVANVCNKYLGTGVVEWVRRVIVKGKFDRLIHREEKRVESEPKLQDA